MSGTIHRSYPQGMASTLVFAVISVRRLWMTRDIRVTNGSTFGRSAAVRSTPVTVRTRR